MNEQLAQALQKANELVQAEAQKYTIWKALLAILQGIVPGFVLPGFGEVNEMTEATGESWDDATFDAFGNATIAECESRTEDD